MSRELARGVALIVLAAVLLASSCAPNDGRLGPVPVDKLTLTRAQAECLDSRGTSRPDCAEILADLVRVLRIGGTLLLLRSTPPPEDAPL